jgi:hypothetical protein
MTQYAIEVLQATLDDPVKVYPVVADSENDAMLLAFALDGGFAGDKAIEEGHLALAKAYCRVL